MQSEKRPFWMVALGISAALTSLLLLLCGLGLMACLSRSFRTPAIRVVGGLVSACCLLTFAASMLGLGTPVPAQRVVVARLRSPGLLVVAAIGAAMAWKGKWPGDEEDHPQASNYHRL